MYIVCHNVKYGFCKFGKICDKIHFTDVCEENENCKEKFCDKRQPVRCSFFEKFQMCKFGTFCSYSHIVNAEEKLKSEVEKLKREVVSLQIRNRQLETKLQNLVPETRTINSEATVVKEINHDNHSNILRNIDKE